MPGGMPIPPMPSKIALVIAGSGGVLLGLALVLRGAANGRFVLALAAAGAAGAASPMLIQVVPFGPLEEHPAIIMVAAALTVGLLAIVFGRLLWALVLGALLGAAWLAVVAWHQAADIPAPAWPAGEAADFTEWLLLLGGYLQGWIGAVWQYRAWLAGASAGVVAVGVAVGLLLPRLALLLTSSVVGALACVAGAGMLLWAGQVQWAERFTRQLHVPAAAAALLALVGAIVQTYFEFGRKKPAEGEADQKKAKSGASKADEP
jgi:hypothetical protein